MELEEDRPGEREPLFRERHLGAERRLSHVARLRGAAEAAMFSHGDDVLQLSQRDSRDDRQAHRQKLSLLDRQCIGHYQGAAQY